MICHTDALAHYDVLIGPIANDTIYDIWGITTGGLLSEAQALEILSVGPQYEQVVVKRGKFARLFFRVTNDSKNNLHQFYYSTDGKHYVAAGDAFSMRSGFWKGIRVALFCYGENGKAQFDFFRMDYR